MLLSGQLGSTPTESALSDLVRWISHADVADAGYSALVVIVNKPAAAALFTSPLQLRRFLHSAPVQCPLLVRKLAQKANNNGIDPWRIYLLRQRLASSTKRVVPYVSRSLARPRCYLPLPCRPFVPTTTITKHYRDCFSVACNEHESIDQNYIQDALVAPRQREVKRAAAAAATEQQPTPSVGATTGSSASKAAVPSTTPSTATANGSATDGSLAGAPASGGRTSTDEWANGPVRKTEPRGGGEDDEEEDDGDAEVTKERCES